MTNQQLGADFGEMMEEEQATVMGGDAYLAQRIGYMVGTVGGAAVNAWNFMVHGNGEALNILS